VRVRVRVGLRARRGGHAHGRRGWWAISPISPLYLPYISPISARARRGGHAHGRRRRARQRGLEERDEGVCSHGHVKVARDLG